MLKKMLRTFRVYLAQTISMIIMIVIGVGIFIGFNMEWKTIEYNVDNFFSQCETPDYTAYSDNGFSETDRINIEKINGISDVSRQLTFDTTYNDKTLSCNIIDNYKLNKFYLVGGKDYDETLVGIWLSDEFAKCNNVTIGDKITITVSGLNKELEVLGLIKQSDYLVCLPENGSQMLPDYNKYGYFYTTLKSIEEFNITIYSKLLIRSNLNKSDVEELVKNELNANLLVLDLSENTSYALANGEKEEGVSMASILPWFFLFIGVLSMVTTMDRIARSEKIEIGTLKALGFKNRTIILYYLLFPLLIGIIGSILGIILGYGVCYYIMNPKGMMGTYFNMPSWNMKMPWFCLLVVILINVLLVFIGYLSIRRMLKGSASDCLKKYVPSKTKALHIEKFKVWDKLSFSSRWNLRDIFHHKARSLMSLIGILGSMILIFASFSMKESVDKFVDYYDKSISNYETRINLSNQNNLTYDEFNKEATILASKYNGDYMNSTSVKYSDETILFNVYNIKNDTYRFLDKKNNKIELPKEGVLICKRIAEENKVKVGDTITISLYGSNKSYDVMVAGVCRSVGEKSIELSEEYARSIGYNDYYITSIFTSSKTDVIEQNHIISSKLSKTDVMETYNTLLSMMDSMLIMLVLASVILGVVVLYNLGIMSYVERYKEFATLKVIGFKNKDISRMMVKQNMWITIIGIILGMPLGYLLLDILIDSLAGEYEMNIYAGPLTFIMSVVFTLVFSLVVNLIVQRKNHKISMVDSLKGNE